MAFPPEFLDEIRARIALPDLVGRKVALKKRGREHEGLCPFHNEKTPSFTVSETKGFFHCFGCGAHGDAIAWVMQAEGLSFPEAVEKLASEAGLPVPQSSPAERQAARHQADLVEVLEQATCWFEAALLGPTGHEAQAYLARRGLSPETIAAFRLGFAPAERGTLRRALNAAGIGDGQLAEAGLIKLAEGEAPRDYFFNRIIYPITDRRGRVIAFGGRAMGDSKAKYLNSPETPLFHKGQVLYNLARARVAAHDTGELIVAEGYMDVIAMSQAGFPAVVAPLGTAVTERQIAELWRIGREPLLCLDGDAAGRRAAMRAAQTALPELAPDRSLRFALLPPGEDPDSLIQAAGAQALRQVLDKAIGLNELIWLGATEGRDLSTPERRAGLWQELGRSVAQIRSQEVQGAYRQAMMVRFEEVFGYNPVSGRRAFQARRSSRGASGVGSKLGGGRGLRQAPQLLRRRRDQGLLATLVNHSEILNDYAEELVSLEIDAPELRRLLSLLVDLAAQTQNLDRTAVRNHLCERGFSKVLEGLLSRQVYELMPFARPDAERSEVRHGWAHLLALYREEEAVSETAEAARLLAQELNETQLSRLQARQRLAEGGESKRVEWDSLEPVGPSESG